MMKLLTRAVLAGALLATGAAGVAATVAQAQSADRYNRHVLIVNNTSQTMVQFFASNTGTNSWEEDLLGSGVLPSGEQIDANIDDGTGYCRYDMKAVFEDGSEQIIPRVNVCEVGRAVFND